MVANLYRSHIFGFSCPMNPTKQTMDSKVESGSQDSLPRHESHTELSESSSSTSAKAVYVGRDKGRSANNGQQVSKSAKFLKYLKRKKRAQPPTVPARTSTTSDSQYASGVQSLSPDMESKVYSSEESVVPSNLGSTQGSNDSGIPDFSELRQPSVTQDPLTQSPEMYSSGGVNPVASSGDQLQRKKFQPETASSHSQADQEQPTMGLGIKGSTLDRHVD